MKKVVFLMAFMLLFLTGCFWNSEKTFTKNGVSINMTDDYEEVTDEFPGYDLVLSTEFAAVFANVEAKEDFVDEYTLDQYTDLVLSQSTSHSTVTKFSEDDVVFNYATYEATSEGVNFKYLLVTMMNDENYLTINFTTQKSKFDDFYDGFLEAAKTIVLE